MSGYDENFLGIEVSLPAFKAGLAKTVLVSEKFKNAKGKTSSLPQGDLQVWMPNIHYSVATSTKRRQPIVVASNINQGKLVDVKRGRWSTDSRVGEFQLDNAYYVDNPWDRGHLARRSSMAWGDSKEAAKRASDGTMKYTNATLQHENFNQDEWLGIEDWVQDLKDDLTNKICVFDGPIYGDNGSKRVFVTPNDDQPIAEVPAAFFKVVSFIGKDKNLAVRAFIAVQDKEALSDKNGTKSRMFTLCTYQVSVKMIEEETGLVFSSALRDANPLYCTIQGDERGVILPEVIPVDSKDDLIGPGQARPAPASSSVRIAAVFPGGSSSSTSAVSIFNSHSDAVSLDGWTLSILGGQSVKLSGMLQRGEAKVFSLNALEAPEDDTISWNILLLLNKEGQRVDRAQFKNAEVAKGTAMTSFNSGGLLSAL